MSDYEKTGSCLCGKISYAITGHINIFQYCHCSRCRKVSGSAHSSNLMIAPEHFRWLSGEENVGHYIPVETRHFATAFCKTCGSSLPWFAKTGKTVIIPAGTLDDDPEIRPSQNIFCASRSAWYVAPGTLPEHDEFPPKKS
jgi:hypothetical protein